MSSNKQLIIIRGLPGAGKSTLAAILSENKYPVHSIDDYFIDNEGNYQFRFQDNHLAYKSCQEKTEADMKAGVERIFLDNTFTLDWEMEPYFKLAEKYFYTLFVVTCENYHGKKNIHGIDDESLAKMAAKYKVKLI